MNIEINFLAVLIAAIASMALGFLWYSPMILGKPWMKAMGYSEKDLKEEQKKMGMYYLLSAILAVITAYVLAHVIGLSDNFYNYTPLMTGLTSAFWMWLGFVLTVQASDTIFSRAKNWQLFAINSSYQLVSLLIMGTIISVTA